MYGSQSGAVGGALQQALDALRAHLTGSAGQAGGGFQAPPSIAQGQPQGQQMLPPQMLALLQGLGSGSQPGGPEQGANPLQAAIAAAQQKMGQGYNPYMTGTQHEHAYEQQLGRRGLSQNQITAAVQDRAGGYAKQRLGQMGQVADLMGGDFAKAYHSQDMSDPAAAYRALSGIFSKQSQSQGVADPRALLAQLLVQSRAR